MPNNKNIEIVKELREKAAKAKSVIFADFAGLKSNDTNELRAQMKEQKAEVSVSKNTLLKIALNEENINTTETEPLLKGNTVTIFSYEDAIAPIKALFEFAKKFEPLKVKAAIIDGKFNNAEQVEAISKLPSREQLLAQVVGTMKSPITGFVNVLNGSQRKFVYAMKAIADKKS